MQLKLTEIDQFITLLKEKINTRDIVVLLRGDLASGKTTLVKNYVSSLGSNDTVTSPTFSIQSIYENNIYHYDVYNKTLNEFVGLGLLEEFEKRIDLFFIKLNIFNLKFLITGFTEVNQIARDKLTSSVVSCRAC